MKQGCKGYIDAQKETFSEKRGNEKNSICLGCYEKGKLTVAAEPEGSSGLATWRDRPVSRTVGERATKCTHGRISLGKSVGGAGVGSLGLLLGVALVELHELGEIELGLLEDLDLLDEHVLKREDLGALLCDLLGDGVGEAKSKY
jgi:hypothetical protein